MIKVEPPSVKDASWPHSPIDHFTLAKLEATGLQPNDPAEKRPLIRRAYLDLIGLPPTPEQVEAFLTDSGSDAFAKVVDELLALDHEKLTYRYSGRDYRLTDVHGNVVHDLIA